VRSNTSGQGSVAAASWSFLRDHRWLVPCLSALVVVPCLWHRHIEAGDLGSHAYNAWLAQLIGKGQAPGLYLARQWNNVLFDVALLHTANVVGFAAAEKIVVSLFVLIFFWGVFAFVAAVTGRPPWFLTPCIAMLAYGYSFNMGFMNYYVSIGLGCFCLALIWREWRAAWRPALVLLTFVYMAHPIGFLWVVGAASYVTIRRLLPGWWKVVPPLAAAAVLVGVRAYLHTRADLQVDWTRSMSVFQSNGADQLMLYGDRYATLALAALFFGLICLVVDVAAAARRKEHACWSAFALSVELYLVTFLATALLPENLHTSTYAGWIGLLVSRLTTISAILGLCVLGCAKLRNWALLGFAVLAAAYFCFLYQDTGALNRLEASAASVLSGVPIGTRIIPTIAADPDWRVEFIGHVADRACVGRCFVYSNYEPSSGQFRVRVAPQGSWIVTSSADGAQDMQGGGYEMDRSDLPAKQLYQCQKGDWTKLCLRDLATGERTGLFGGWPGK
jgi:hypothetical protein